MTLWVNAFTTDRKLAFDFDGKSEAPEPCNRALPQGSPISPIHSAITACAIVETQKRGIQITQKQDKFNTSYVKRRQRWLSGTILTSLVLDSTGFWVRISARTPILRKITTGGDITGGFCPGAGFPSCHKLIHRVSEDNFRGSACVSEWMFSVKIRWGVGLS
jgi:hypothetical protein